MINCKNCSIQLQAGSMFCYGCGTLDETTEENDFKIECEMHPGRYAVGLCVICGKPVCSDCEVKSGKKILCADPEHKILLQEWCLIHQMESEFEAEALMRNLADNGIEGRMFSLHDHIASHWLNENRVVLFVKNLERDKAKSLLKNLNLIDND